MDKKIIKEDLFENILQGFTDPVIFLSKDFRILWANRVFQEQTNYRIEEIIGNHCYRISHHTETPCDSLLCSCPIIEATRTANTETVTHTHFDKDGNKLFIENTVYPLKNEKGEIIQFICIYRDITERKRTEEELRETKQLLETILDHTHMLVAYLDPEFNFIQVNRAYAAADEREVSFFPGKKHFALYPNEENEEIFQRVVETGKPFYAYAKPFEYAEHPERGLTYWDWSLVPIKDREETVRGLVLTLTNVTDRNLMEIALQERIKELNCLYSIADLVKRDTPLEEILQKTAELIPHAWRYPEINCARIILNGQEFKTKNFTDTTYKQSAEIVVYGETVGTVEVCCLKEKRESDEGPFLKEERSLINAIAERLSRITERMKAEVALQKAHDELEIKVHERTQELLKMNKALLNEIAERKKFEKKLRQSHELLKAITASQSQFIVDVNPNKLFSGLLSNLLSLTESEYGFIDGVLFNPQGKPYLKTHAISNIAWNEKTRAFYEKHASKGIELYNLKTLFGKVVTTGKAVISHDPSSDPRRGGLPEGHPPLKSFLGVPIRVGKKLVGVIGIANRPNGYDKKTIHYLQPFLGTCAKLIEAYESNKQRKQAEEDLKESREQLRKLYAHLQSAREEERTRIAREFHDEFGTIMTALKIDISWLQKKLPGKQNILIDKTRKSLDLINSAIKTVQRISSDLRPLILDHLGLAEAIEWQLREFGNRTGITCTHFINITGIKLNRELSIAVFRIIQEAFTNIARHAKATKVDVSLKEKDNFLILEVSDDGKGITHKQLSNTKSFGLHGIRERVQYLGGDFKIKGVRNKGTSLSVMIPLSLKEE